jgi:hypothetical protein
MRWNGFGVWEHPKDLAHGFDMEAIGQSGAALEAEVCVAL